jgi:toxin YoeB
VDLVFLPGAWEDYQYWLNNDIDTLKKINTLIKDIQREPFKGIGKPEPLKFDLKGWWSRRINHEDRMVYKIENNKVIILQCRMHY